jgi:hypothetical protein
MQYLQDKQFSNKVIIQKAKQFFIDINTIIQCLYMIEELKEYYKRMEIKTLK